MSAAHACGVYANCAMNNGILMSSRHEVETLCIWPFESDRRDHANRAATLTDGPPCVELRPSMGWHDRIQKQRSR